MARVELSEALGRRVDARPDTIDFRDLMYIPTLVEVPSYIELKEFRNVGTPIQDQGKAGACTGFGLSTVANYLLHRRQVVREDAHVSPWMLYDIAKRFDE